MYGDGSPAEIVVIFGDDWLDLLFVTLHEIGHAINPPLRDSLGRTMAHTRKFYETVGELYAVYGIPLTYAVFREGGFKRALALPILRQRYEAYGASA